MKEMKTRLLRSQGLRGCMMEKAGLTPNALELLNRVSDDDDDELIEALLRRGATNDQINQRTYHGY